MSKTQEIRARWKKALSQPWKAILWGNETYPFPLSIETQDGATWIARDGTASSLDAIRAIGSAPNDIAHLLSENARLREALETCKGWSRDRVQSLTESFP